MKKTILILGIIFLLVGVSVVSSIENKTSSFRDIIIQKENGSCIEHKNWTFMAYLDGDGFDLEEDIPLFINNMELVGSNSKVNVVAQADDYTKWGGETRRYYITYDTNPKKNDYNWNNITSLLADNDTSEKNMGNQKTLSDFVKWSVENYPADHYCLTIFNHGGGFHGLCWDSTFLGDRLTMPEF